RKRSQAADARRCCRGGPLVGRMQARGIQRQASPGYGHPSGKEGGMSIKVMSMVWDGFPASGSELLAMLALADWCNDEGGSLYPSIAAVAKKIRVSDSQARRIMHKFQSAGYLSVVGNHAGGAPGM